MLATEEYADSVDRGCPMVLGGPLSHVMAAKAVALAEARQPSFQTYAQNIADNAKSLADGFMSRGAKLVTGGTDNHIVLLDVSSYGLTGRQAESALLDAGVVTNRNSVPADPNGAWYTSGHPVRHPGADHPRLRPRRVRPGRRAGRRRAREHHAGHHQGRRAVQGDVHPGRRRRRPHQGRVGRDARQAPAVPRPRARAETHPGAHAPREPPVCAPTWRSSSERSSWSSPFLLHVAASSALTAVAVAAVVVAAVWAGAHLSGGHFNPAVTLAIYLAAPAVLADLLVLLGRAARRRVRRGAARDDRVPAGTSTART